ncbi:putative nitrilase [Mycena indigotica]|uniref:Putative nitrilase n=1 Tax=Mycena indigotica TaxID=2126181 RepID=A0A8H6VXE2_9AGAR|nr:putative nitrilase [Mycena indigotica]KAF7297377.1 putative nitrilase [Mycena indigotica]
MKSANLFERSTLHADVQAVRVATVQAEPAWWDLKAGVSKTISIIKEAAANGAEVIGFPESFIPGYPMVIWTHGFNPEFLAKFKANALDVRSDEFKSILEAAKNAGIWVVLGFTEREAGTMYGAQVIINAQGVVVLHRRKIKATGQERTIWGDGPADSIQSVVSGPDGIKLGALNCWEHLQPLLRYYGYHQGVQLQISSWPLFLSMKQDGHTDFQSSGEGNALQAQFTALEGQTFVISSTQILRPENVEICGLTGVSGWEKGGGGFAAIYGPDGKQLTPPTQPDEETILYAEVDTNQVLVAKLLADPVGHYFSLSSSRPDLLSLKANPRPHPFVTEGEPEADATLLRRLHNIPVEIPL